MYTVTPTSNSLKCQGAFLACARMVGPATGAPAGPGTGATAASFGPELAPTGAGARVAPTWAGAARTWPHEGQAPPSAISPGFQNRLQSSHQGTPPRLGPPPRGH